MRLLFLGLNYAPEEIGIAVYSSGMAEYLAAAGHDVEAVSAQPYYPDWQVRPDYRGWWRRSREAGVALTRVPLYVPARPTGARRILHHVSFAASALPAMLASAVRSRPDAILTVAPSLIAAPVALVLARLLGVPAWLHVQDFEVGAAMGTGLIGTGSRTSRWALMVERAVMRRFDRVSSISPEMCAKLVGMGIAEARVVEFRNWAQNLAKPGDPGRYRETWAITTPHVALYSGNIANKQGIEIVIDAAERLRDRQDLTFIICGQGPNRAALEQRARGLPNVRIHDLQPVEALPDLLALATVHLLPQRAATADLVLPSKLTNMLASGRPIIVTASPGTGLAREVSGCGLVTPPEDAAALVAAIEQIVDDPDRAIKFGAAARDRAHGHWNKNQVLSRFTALLTQLVYGRDQGEKVLP